MEINEPLRLAAACWDEGYEVEAICAKRRSHVTGDSGGILRWYPAASSEFMNTFLLPCTLHK